jgi:hypothetical protein
VKDQLGRICFGNHSGVLFLQNFAKKEFAMKLNTQMISGAVFALRRSFLTVTCLAIAGILFTAAPALAGSPHFVGTCTATLNPDNTVTFTGKEAGLGGEAQISSTLTVIAECINNGGNHPKASNKTANTTGTSVPVQNGMADYNSSNATTSPVTTSPSCSPQMTLAIASATITDNTNGISQSCTVQ